MMCHYPTAEMKFTVTMMRVSESPAGWVAAQKKRRSICSQFQKDPPFFEFVIRKGETSEFQNLVEQLRKCFKVSVVGCWWDGLTQSKKMKLAEMLGLPVKSSLSKAGGMSAEARKLLQSSLSLQDSQELLLSSGEGRLQGSPKTDQPASTSPDQ